MIEKALTVAVIALSLCSVGAKANLLIDGGFDNPTVNPIPFAFYTNYGPVAGDPNYGGASFDNAWTITGNVDLVQQLGGWPASPVSSPYYVDLNGNIPGSISQSFMTTADQVYSLSFWYSNNAGGSPRPTHAEVDLTGASPIFIQHDGATTTNLDWTLYSTTFTGTGTPMTLSFTQLDNCCQGGILLDSVNVAAVPEPATWALIIFGFLGIGFMGYRRRSSLIRIA